MSAEDHFYPKYCPECGAPMHDLDPHGHRLYHYPAYLEPSRTDAKAARHAEQIERGGVSYGDYVAGKEG